MVTIVIVSHSAKLAEGVRELAEQMVQGKVPLVTAGGIDDPENPLGTDAMRVYQAIESVYSNEGVVVLMDLGSALMSAEMALDFLSEEQRANVYLCEAPLVEGAIAAAVQAASGSNITQVIAEARGALAAKAAQLSGSSSVLAIEGEKERGGDGETGRRGDGEKEIQLVVRNLQGLHARPAAQFVATASRFQSQISVRNLTRDIASASAKSINQLAMLGVKPGDAIAISAEGADAEAALVALQALVASNFGEELATSYPPSSPVEKEVSVGELIGIPVSPGIAIGSVMQYRPLRAVVRQWHVNEPQLEWERLQTAIQTAQQEIEALRQRTVTQVGAQEAAIFEAHLLFLTDPVLLDPVRQRIFDHHINAEAAWNAEVDQLANAYRNLEDDYLRSRAADVIDVGQRVLRLLAASANSNLPTFQPANLLTSPHILIATELTPSDTAQLNPQQILGICTAFGGATSHSAILARALGIPAVVGLGEALLQLADGTEIALDGDSGKVWIEPNSGQLAALPTQQREKNHPVAPVEYPAMTRDGQPVKIVANIGSLAEAQAAIKLGAEGVGLLRTEFLYLDQITAPSAAEQLEVYQAIAQVLAPHPLIIRTLDVGGDKPLPYLNLGQEANPFLGLRGIRLCLAHPNLFKTQLRAILQASTGYSIKLMFPMVTSLSEVQAAKAILREAQADIPDNETIEVGIMIETPAAVAIADKLAAEVDFFSIGTNDLSQYMIAADRNNPRVATLADALHPAVLRAIHQTVQAAHNAGIWVGLCGELAGNPLAAPILLGLGIDELSMSPPGIAAVKQAIAQFTLEEANAIAATVLQLDSAAAVKHYITHH